MSRTEWRSPGAYEELRFLDAPGFAWEYLRRNPQFVRNRAKLERAAARGALLRSDADEFAQRWGVRFRDKPRRNESASGSVDRSGAAKCCSSDRRSF